LIFNKIQTMRTTLDEQAIDKLPDDLRIAVRWWEGKRGWYNALVGLSGVPIFFFLGVHFFTLAGALAYGVAANLLYSLGLLSEIWTQHYFGTRLLSPRIRWVLWLIGLLGSMGLTLAAVLAGSFAILSLQQM
jgi:hypothetical protein